MKNPYLKYCFLMVLVLTLSKLRSQEAFPVTGGNVSGSGGSVSYSVGQIFYQTQEGSKGSLSEGVQHPYIISVVTEITGTKEIHLSVVVYPNPVTHVLNLEVANFGSGNMAYLVSDINGKLLQHVRITGPKTSIEMGHLPPSTYILNLVEENHIVKSYKIIKN
jgi:hypothetical protein